MVHAGEYTEHATALALRVSTDSGKLEIERTYEAMPQFSLPPFDITAPLFNTTVPLKFQR